MVCHDGNQANPDKNSRFTILLQRTLRSMDRSLRINEFVAGELKAEREIRQMARLLKEDQEHCACLRALLAEVPDLGIKEMTVPCETVLTPLEGLRWAIDEELQSVSLCLELADLASDQVKDAFRKLAMTQQQHAVWLLYFYTLNKK
ncbi:MAG: hypothetical protein ABF651_00700 [Sporolactobacillus sp.]